MITSHNLSIETGRHSNTKKKQTSTRCCLSCFDCVEDEYHVILVCLYANFRRKNIKEYMYYYKRSSMFTQKATYLYLIRENYFLIVLNLEVLIQLPEKYTL